MNCKRVIFRLHAYVDGELSDDLIQEVGTHLSTCPLCQQEFDRIRNVGDMLDGLRVPPLAESFSVRLMAEARRVAPNPKAKGFFSPLEWQLVQWFLDLSSPMRMAACAIVLLACFSGLFMSKELSLPRDHRVFTGAAENLEGFELFGPAPPASLSAAYLALAYNVPQGQDEILYKQ